jgi:hypothetical protein
VRTTSEKHYLHRITLLTPYYVPPPISTAPSQGVHRITLLTPYCTTYTVLRTLPSLQLQAKVYTVLHYLHRITYPLPSLQLQAKVATGELEEFVPKNRSATAPDNFDSETNWFVPVTHAFCHLFATLLSTTLFPSTGHGFCHLHPFHTTQYSTTPFPQANVRQDHRRHPRPIHVRVLLGIRWC